MWVFLPCGFFSVVLSPAEFQRGRVDGTRIVMVRARFRRHLMNIVDRYFGKGILEPQEMQLMETPDRDYGYRLLMRAEAWAEILYRETTLMETVNFKAATEEAARRLNGGVIHDDAEDYAATLHDVWRLMDAMQSREREAPISRAKRMARGNGGERKAKRKEKLF